MQQRRPAWEDQAALHHNVRLTYAPPILQIEAPLPMEVTGHRLLLQCAADVRLHPRSRNLVPHTHIVNRTHHGRYEDANEVPHEGLATPDDQLSGHLLGAPIELLAVVDGLQHLRTNGG